jgi:hypothetical protein
MKLESDNLETFMRIKPTILNIYNNEKIPIELLFEEL